jgi:glutamate-5-semialdehyde dehydrogenase
MPDVRETAERAKVASRRLAMTSAKQRNRALLAMSHAVMSRQDEIIAANEKDMAAAREKRTSEALLDRLALDPQRLKSISEAIKGLAALADPLGEVVTGTTMANGIKLSQVRVPIGVVAMIYEARPNVTADAAALCVKTGNAVVLRGGSLAYESCLILTRVLANAATGAGLPEDAIQYVESVEHSAADELMGLHGLIDVLIPRGGADLIKSVVKKAKVPVIETGNCHVYVHESADPEMAKRIVVNAKCQRPAVCNAAETLLIDDAFHAQMLPPLLKALEAEGVTVFGDEKTCALGAITRIQPATEDDWHAEYYDLKIACRVVDDMDAALEHIAKYGTGHSEAIVTQDYAVAQRFVDSVDAAAVYVNASTRFTDGGEFGLGAEIGISTQKLHARGPMGLAALTSTKWIALGNGQIRE